MRLVGVDFGGRHIGLAVAETSHKLCSPRKPIDSSGTLSKDATAILMVTKVEEADAIVIGLPMDMDGETKMSRVCRQLGACLESLGSKVYYVDESLTSYEAETEMLRAGLKGSQIRARVDGEAACRILERFMESNG